MSLSMKLLIGAGIVFIGVGLVGNYYSFENKSILPENNYLQGNNAQTNRIEQLNQYSNNQYTKEKLSIQDLKDKVNIYIGNYDIPLKISDIFIFENSDYYFSIEEKDTGLGAMELLVNPYTGYVYPEHGPNIMWNEKYGMMGGYNGYYGGMRGGYNRSNGGMMGSYNRGYGDKDDYNGYYGGMMGGYNRSYGSTMGSYNFTYEDVSLNNALSIEDAANKANTYVKAQFGENYSIEEKGHEFYGYYTFHIDEDDKTVGMLSINGDTGDVWYHNWHGSILEVIHDNEISE